MITKQLLDYIAQEIRLGVALDTIKATLRSNGWIETDIEQALHVSTPIPQSVALPVRVAQPEKTEFFMPPQKKSSKMMIFLIILLVLIVCGGLVYAGFVFTSSPSLEVTTPTATIPNPIPKTLPVASSIPEIPAAIATSTATTTPSLAFATSTASTTPATATVQDCGSVNTSRMNSLNGISAMNAQDKAALACASKTFATCSPTILIYTTTGTTTTSTLNINGLINSNCSLTMSSNVSSNKPTCQVPMDLMTQIVESAKKSSPGGLFSYPVVSAGLFFMGTPLTNTLTGKKVTPECTQ